MTSFLQNDWLKDLLPSSLNLFYRILIFYLNIFVIPKLILFIVKKNNLLSSSHPGYSEIGLERDQSVHKKLKNEVFFQPDFYLEILYT